MSDYLSQSEDSVEGNIVIVDDNDRFVNAAQRTLNNAGFHNVETATTAETALGLVDSLNPYLTLIDIHLKNETRDGLDFLCQLRANGYKGIAVIITVDRSRPQFFRAARAGANDFLVKSPRLDLRAEVKRILARHHSSSDKEWHPQSISELGYLRSFGLTPREISILAEYATDFPRYKILADRVSKSERQIRKTFSRICKKLGVDNLSQLAHVLTVCAMFDEQE